MTLKAKANPNRKPQPYYQRGDITIYRGDARDVLPAVVRPGEMELLLTDPPYGMAYQSTKKATVRGDGVRQGVRLLREVLGECEPLLSTAAHLYVFCHWESWPDFYDGVSGYAQMKNALIWWKAQGGMGDTALEYARDFEVILYAVKSRERPLAGKREGAVIEGIPPVPRPASGRTRRKSRSIRWRS